MTIDDNDAMTMLCQTAKLTSYRMHQQGRLHWHRVRYAWNVNSRTVKYVRSIPFGASATFQ